jgi:hypothetical protein
MSERCSSSSKHIEETAPLLIKLRGVRQ